MPVKWHWFVWLVKTALHVLTCYMLPCISVLWPSCSSRYRGSFSTLPHPLTSSVGMTALLDSQSWHRAVVSRQDVENQLHAAWVAGIGTQSGAFKTTGIVCSSWVRVVRFSEASNLLAIGLASGIIRESGAKHATHTHVHY